MSLKNMLFPALALVGAFSLPLKPRGRRGEQAPPRGAYKAVVDKKSPTTAMISNNTSDMICLIIATKEQEIRGPSLRFATVRLRQAQKIAFKDISPEALISGIKVAFISPAREKKRIKEQKHLSLRRIGEVKGVPCFVVEEVNAPKSPLKRCS